MFAGLLLGAVWGGLARLWMRLLTTSEPGFTWSGTAFIVGIFAVAGMSAGLVAGARRRRWRGTPMRVLRVVGFSGTVVLSLGQGALMAPTLVLGGLAIAGRGGRRGLLGLLALTPVALVHGLAARDWPHSPLRLLAAVLLCLAVYGGAAAALAQSYAVTPGAALPRRSWLGLLLLPLMGLLVVGAGSGGPVVGLVLAVLLVGVVALLAVRRRRGAPAEVPRQRKPTLRSTSERGPTRRV